MAGRHGATDATDVGRGSVSLAEFIRKRERGGHRPPSHRFTYATRKLPHILKERELKGLDRCDKIFASAWLDPERVMVGTKDNQLLVWDVKKDRHSCIPSFCSTVEGLRHDHCGIHSIAISAQGVIATGAQAPQDILLLGHETLRPQALLKGHSDWVFALAWLAPNILVSGGRDRSVMIWDTSSGESSPGIIKPAQVRVYHRDKVRDLKAHGKTGSFGTVSADGTVKFWDAEEGVPVSSVDLEYKHELVCMACDSDLNTFAVGSESHIQMVDPRTAGVYRCVPSLDPGGSVRSLSVHDHLMTVGTGGGTISFLDLRTDSFLQMNRPSGRRGWAMGGDAGADCVRYLTTGNGYLKRDDVFLQHFDGLEVRHTVYTHCYDPTYTKLFVGGGPLPVGLCGCYAAVW